MAARLSTKKLSGLCRRVGTSLAAGLDVRKIWGREAERASGQSRQQFEVIRDRIGAGDSLVDALAATNSFLPPMVHDMVRVGEQTGHIDEVFIRLAEHYEHQLALRRTFLAGIAWPMIQLVAAICIIGVLIWVMGIIGQMTGETVDILGLGLVGTKGLLIYIGIVAAIAAVATIILRAVSRGLLWAAPIQRLLLRLPVLGNSLRTLALARMAWTLSLTSDSGMDPMRSLTLAIGSTHNVQFTQRLQQVVEHLKDGGEIHEALRLAGGYPPDFLDAIEVGEQTGQVSESMAHLAQIYKQRAQAALAVLTMFAGFIVWGMVALVIIAMIFRLASFYIGNINRALEGF